MGVFGGSMSGSAVNMAVAGACYFDRIMSPWLECHPRMKSPVPRETSSNFFAGGLPMAGPRHFRKEQDGRASGRLVRRDQLVEYPFLTPIIHGWGLGR